MEERLKIYIAEDCDMLMLDESLIQCCHTFNCGDEDLNDFFVKDAIAYQKNGVGISYCWVLKDDVTRIVGFMTVANSGLPTTHLSNNPKRHLNKRIPYLKQGRTYPGVLIGRLAVDLQFQGRGFRIGSQMKHTCGKEYYFASRR